MNSIIKNIRSDFNVDKVSQTDQVKEDWTSFQYASKLIQVCGNVIYLILWSNFSRNLFCTCQLYKMELKFVIWSLLGNLLLKIEEFESSLFKDISTFCQKWLEIGKKKKNSSSSELFSIFNYLKKENGLEFSSLMEFLHKIENGVLHW